MHKAVIYIASTYSGTPQERNQRHREVQAYTAHLLSQGLTAISPIVHNHSMAALHRLPHDFKFWQNYCLNLLAVCDCMHVLMLTGWEKSIGVQAEIAEAHALEITVKYIDPKVARDEAKNRLEIPSSYVNLITEKS